MERVCGADEVSYERLEEFKYLRAVIHETLRLAPPVPLDFKKAVADDILPNGMRVKKGTMIAWFAWGLGRSSHYYDNPLEFRPERWMGDNGGKKVPNSLSTSPPFIPFQMVQL